MSKEQKQQRDAHRQYIMDCCLSSGFWAWDDSLFLGHSIIHGKHPT
jgi:hypothetical protein